MEITQQPKLTFHGVEIAHLAVNFKQPFTNEGDIEAKISPKVVYSKENKNDFRIVMEVELEVENIFSISLFAIGSFKFAGEFPDVEQRKGFINLNAPAIMFPYIRSFISTLTANLGAITPTIVLPPYFFKGELEEFNKDTIEETN